MEQELELKTTTFQVTDWSRWQVQLMREIVRYKKTHGELPNHLMGCDAMGRTLEERSSAWAEDVEGKSLHPGDHHEMTELIMELGGAPNAAMGFVVDDDIPEGDIMLVAIPMEEGGPDTAVEACDEQFTMEDWDQWDQEIFARTEAFKETHGVFPNLLAASQDTFTRVNQAAASSLQEEGEESGEDIPELESFSSPDFELTFCLHPEAAEGEFLLIYDPEPQFEAEEEE